MESDINYMESGRRDVPIPSLSEGPLWGSDFLNKAPGDLLDLHADYPEPLTGFQRRLFSKHVGQQVRKYSIIRRSTRAVRHGYESLRNLVVRLTRERAEIEEYLNPKGTRHAQDANKNRESGRSTQEQNEADAKRPKVEVERGGEEEKREGTKQADATSSSSNSIVGTSNKPANRRGFGGLLRSAAFANMQKVLRSAQKEGEEHCASIAQQRERIAKQTRLSLLQEDLQRQEQLMEPLEQKLAKCEALEGEMVTILVPLLELWQEMFSKESEYAATFSLCAAGPPERANARGPGSKCEPVRATTSPAACETEGEAGGAAPLPSSRALAGYEIPFLPAFLTPEAGELLRGQVEEVLDGYLAFRARIDPILAKLDALAREQAAARAKQLMAVIGIGPNEGRDLIDLGFAAPDASPNAKPTGEPRPDLPGAAGRLRSLIQGPLGISDDSESEEEGLGKARSGGEGESEEPNNANEDQLERHKIQSALSALDDFEEIY